MPLSGLGRWPRALGPLPRHDLKVKNVDVIEIVLTIPATEDVHLGPTDNVRRVVEPRRWCTGSSRTLIPSHGDWIERVEILERLVLSTLTTEDDDTRSGKQSSVAEPWSRWRALYFWLDPPARIQVQHVSVVEIDVALLLATVVVPTKVQDGGTNESRRVASSSTWWHTFDLGEGPEPRSVGIYRKRNKNKFQ